MVTRCENASDSLGGPKDRYYNDDEYKRLSANQKLALKEMRLKRGHKPGDGSNRSNKRQKVEKVSKKAFNRLKRQVAVLTHTKGDSNSDTNDKDDDSKGNDDKSGGNRNHKALTRKK